MGHRPGAAFWDEVFWWALRHYVRHRRRTTRFDRTNSTPAHHARLLHGSARGVSVAARDQDAGRPGRAPERKRAADCRVSEPASQGDARALSAAEKTS